MLIAAKQVHHFITKNTVAPSACNNHFTSYKGQCNQDLICANMYFEQPYVTVKLRFKCIQHY